MRDQVRHEDVSSIVGSISEVLATASFIQDGLHRLPNTNTYKARLTSDRVAEQLTSVLLSRVFNNPIAYGKIAFNSVRNPRDENRFWLFVTFELYTWSRITFDIKQFEQNVQGAHGTLHPYNAHHDLLAKIEREAIAHIPRAHSTPPDSKKNVHIKPLDMQKLRRVSDGDAPLASQPHRRSSMFGDARKENPVKPVVDAKMIEAEGEQKRSPYLKRSLDGMQPCHRGRSPDIKPPIQQAQPQNQRRPNLFEVAAVHHPEKKRVGFIAPVLTPRV